MQGKCFFVSYDANVLGSDKLERAVNETLCVCVCVSHCLCLCSEVSICYYIIWIKVNHYKSVSLEQTTFVCVCVCVSLSVSVCCCCLHTREWKRTVCSYILQNFSERKCSFESVYFIMLLFYNPLFFFFLQDKGAFRKAETARESSRIPAGRFSKKVSRKINRAGLG